MSELFQQQQQQQEELQRAAEEAARERSRERRRSSIGTLALPVGSDQQQNLNTSVNFGADEIEFEAQGVKINKDGLFIHDENVSEVHQDDLAVLTELGRGACSVVKKAQHVQTRELYAIKVFSLFDKDKRAQLLKEVETLWSMQCPSLISFVGGYLKDGSIHIVLEYMDRGSLTELIHDWRDLEYGEDLMAAITIQILWGLGYLHFEHRVHRDIKPQNVLLNSKGEVKLSDFGIARELEGEMDLAQTMVGTIRYMSPERLAGAGYGVTADVWSVGVVLMEMAGRRLPFDTMVSQIDLHDRLQQDVAVDELLKLVPGQSPEFEEVLRGCLQSNPDARLSPAELLELEWFRPFRRPGGTTANGSGCGQESGGMKSPSVITEATEGMSSDYSGDSGDEKRGGKRGEKEVASEQAEGGGTKEGNDAGDDDDGGGGEQHDLDKAANIVREYILQAVEHGILAGEPFPGESSPGVSFLPMGANGNGGYDSGATEMIQTMKSDLSETDSAVASDAGLQNERGELHSDNIFDGE